MKNKIVLDTNVLISAFLWQRNIKEIFDLAKRNVFDICANQEILNEFQKVLSYPKFQSRLTVINKMPKQIANEFLEIVKFYPSEKFDSVIIKVDPADDKFLACALTAKADFIVSGDKHLLKLKFFQNIPILSPKEFLKQFSQIKKQK